jgi:hypothetical protein
MLWAFIQRRLAARFTNQIFSGQIQMATLSQASITFLETALVQNPKATFFPWSFSDFPFSSFPQGVPRASVLSAYKTAASQIGNFNLVPLGGDNFQRANEDPLFGPQPSGANNWINVGDGLESVNGQALATTTLANCGAFFYGAVLPNDQWVSVTVGAFQPSPTQAAGAFNSAQIELGLRISSGGTFGYVFQFENFTLFEAIVDIENQNGIPLIGAADLTPPVANSGDVLTAVAVGSQLFFFHNNVLIASGTDTLATAGFAGLQFPAGFFEPTGSVTCGITSFACGAAFGGPNPNVF